MDNSAIQSSQKRIAAHLKIICRFKHSGGHVLLFITLIIAIPSNAESHEDQDSSKQNFVGGMIAELAKTWKRNENQIFKPC